MSHKTNSSQVLAKEVLVDNSFSECLNSNSYRSPAFHSILILSDSALPLGSFAFSSGLESFLAHQPRPFTTQQIAHFLLHSLAYVARSSLPFLKAAFLEPADILLLDDSLDACTPCSVARRASVAQGRALLTVWERSLRHGVPPSVATDALKALSSELKRSSLNPVPASNASAHFPVVFGAVAAALDLEFHAAAHVFLLNHLKACLSAAVRAGIVGPFQAQSYLADTKYQDIIIGRVQESKAQTIPDAGQVWISGDIFIGRHDLLYSRIFNS